MTRDHQGADLRLRLLREARRLTADPNEAEDLVQECLLALHRHRSDLRDPRKLLSWCRTVLRNAYRQRLQRRWYSEVRGLTDLSPPATEPWESVDASLMLDGALQTLAPRTRRVLREFYLVGHTIAAIAAHESRPEGTIKRWLHDGREALRMALSEPQPDAPLARIYATNWMDDTRRAVESALREAGYRPEWSTLGEDASLPHDTALLVLGEQAGPRSGLELLLFLRHSPDTASTPVMLFGPGRQSALVAAWQAGADCYLTDPSSPEVVHFLRKLRNAHTTPHCCNEDA
jgi:RNA polymerase sigma factor (sigma-70 family)